MSDSEISDGFPDESLEKLEEEVSIDTSDYGTGNIDQASEQGFGASSSPAKIKHASRVNRKHYDKVATGDFRRILSTLDYHQHLNLPAHLYSSYLIKKHPNRYLKRTVHKKFYDHWSSWPTENAPCPPKINDIVPSNKPGPTSLGRIRAMVTSAAVNSPSCGPDNPSKILLDACETVMQRIVYQRIHSETRFPQQLEPKLDPEPRIATLWPAALIETVDKYLQLPELRNPPRKYHPGSVSYRDLALDGPTLERVRKLFEAEGSEIDGLPSEDEENLEAEHHSDGDSEEDVSASETETVNEAQSSDDDHNDDDNNN